MKITEREFAKVARVKAIEAIGDLCDAGTGLPRTMEELITCKCFNTLSRMREILFEGKDECVEVEKGEILAAAAKASGDGDDEHHFMDGFGPLGFMAVTLMEAEMIQEICKELSKEEKTNGNN